MFIVVVRHRSSIGQHMSVQLTQIQKSRWLAVSISYRFKTTVDVLSSKMNTFGRAGPEILGSRTLGWVFRIGNLQIVCISWRRVGRKAVGHTFVRYFQHCFIIYHYNTRADPYYISMTFSVLHSGDLHAFPFPFLRQKFTSHFH